MIRAGAAARAAAVPAAATAVKVVRVPNMCEGAAATRAATAGESVLVEHALYISPQPLVDWGRANTFDSDANSNSNTSGVARVDASADAAYIAELAQRDAEYYTMPEPERFRLRYPPSLPHPQEEAAQRVAALRMVAEFRAVTARFGLPEGFLAPLVVMHFTMSRAEIIRLIRTVHTPLYASTSAVHQPAGNRSKNPATVEEEPGPHNSIRPLVNEVEACGAALAVLSKTLKTSSPQNQGDKTSRGAAPPDLNFWFVDVFGGAKSVFAKDTTQTKAGASDDTLLVQMFRVDMPALCLVAFLHGIRINGHGDDPRHVLGVFPTACKFNHSCAPNTCWHLLSPYQDGGAPSSGIAKNDDSAADADGGGKAPSSLQGDKGAGTSSTRLQRPCSPGSDNSAFASARHCPLWRRGLDEYLGVVQHVATRDVAAGTHFTFSYIGTGWNLLAPAFVRRGMLAHLNFCCGCERCASADLDGASRPIQCAACRRARVVAAKQRNRGEDAGGSVAEVVPYFLTSTVQLHPAHGWCCTVCATSPPSEALSMALLHERRIVQDVMAYYFGRVQAGAEADPTAALPPTAWRRAALLAVGSAQAPADVRTLAPADASSGDRALVDTALVLGGLYSRWVRFASTDLAHAVTVRNNLGPWHYMYPTACAGITPRAVDALAATSAAVTELADLLADRMSALGGGAAAREYAVASVRQLVYTLVEKQGTTPPAGGQQPLPVGPLTELRQCLQHGLRWFDRFMQGTPQHRRYQLRCARCAVLVGSLHEALLKIDGSGSNFAAALGDEAAAFAPMAQIASTELGMALSKWKEFQ